MNLRILALCLLGSIFIAPYVFSNAFNLPLFYPRKSFVEFILAAIALVFAFESDIKLPTKNMLVISGFLFVSKFLAILLNFNWVTGFNLLDAIALGIAAFYFATIWDKYKLTLQNLYWPMVISCLGLIALTLWQFIISRIIGGQTSPFFYSGFFGNINMLSEYFILVLPLLFFLLRLSTGLQKTLLHFVSGGWIFVILIGQSRAAWLGLGLCLIMGFIAKIFTKWNWSVFAISLLLALGTLLIPNNGGENQFEAKQKSLGTRSEIYRGTLSMFVDNPTGVGGDQFEFNYIPYQMGTTQTPQELVRFESPHNEFIRWGIENGWSFLFIVVVWWFFIFKFNWKSNDPVKPFKQMILLVMMPQLFFQFPFNNPASLFLISFLLAFVCIDLTAPTIKMRGSIRFILIAFAVLFFAKTFNQTYSRWIESARPNDAKLVRLACNLDPTNWRVCFYDEMFTLQSSYASDAVHIAKNQLRMRPFEFRALRVLGIYNFMDGKTEAACEMANVYDVIFKNKSYFTPVISENCVGTTSPVTFQSSEQFNHDYRQWLSKYITK